LKSLEETFIKKKVSFQHFPPEFKRLYGINKCSNFGKINKLKINRARRKRNSGLRLVKWKES